MTKLIRQHSKALPATAQPIPHARLHDLRHLHATTLLLAGFRSTWWRPGLATQTQP